MYADLSGKVAVITGGSKGIGAATARALAANGVAVAVVARDRAAIDATVESITAKSGRAIGVTADCTSEADLQALRETVAAQLGAVHILAAFVGGNGMPVPTQVETGEHWRAVVESELTSTFLTVAAFLPDMISRHSGVIITMSSSAARQAAKSSAAYAAAKAGLVGLTNVIAIEGEAHGILANSVMPTGFSRMVTETVGDEKFLAESGFMRAIRPELVVPLVTFLASSSCTFTHRNYSASAGRYARVFVGLSEGWLADAESEPTAEDIEAHLEQISATEKFFVPTSIVDEVLEVCERRGISAMPDNADVAFPEPERNRG